MSVIDNPHAVVDPRDLDHPDLQPLEPSAVRQTVFAVALEVLGSIEIFASFFLTFLSVTTHAPRAAVNQNAE